MNKNYKHDRTYGIVLTILAILSMAIIALDVLTRVAIIKSVLP